jgi:hypothetical protein
VKYVINVWNALLFLALFALEKQQPLAQNLFHALNVKLLLHAQHVLLKNALLALKLLLLLMEFQECSSS